MNIIPAAILKYYRIGGVVSKLIINTVYIKKKIAGQGVNFFEKSF